MSGKRANRFWRTMRLVFRWSRIFVWFVLFVAVAAIVYLTTIGLPDFLKTPLVAELHQRGWDVEFSRMRWHWFRGVVIDNPTFSPADKTSGAKFSAERAELNADFSKILDSKVTLKSLLLRQGKLVATVETNTEPLVIKNIQATVLLLPDNRLVIESFSAQFKEVRFQLSCDLKNAAALRELSFLLPEKEPTDAPQTAVKTWFESVEQIQFADEPVVKLDVSGDLLEWQKMKARLSIGTAGAITPWGRFEGVAFEAQMNSARANNFPVFSFDLSASNLTTQWGSATDLSQHVSVTFSKELTDVLDCDWDLSGSDIHTHWITDSATNLIHSKKVEMSGTALLSLTNFLPVVATGKVNARNSTLRWQQPGTADLWDATLSEADLSVNYDASSLNSAESGNLGFWRHLQPFIISGRFNFTQLNSKRLSLEKLLVAADWSWPRFEIMDFQSALYDGTLETSGGLDVVTRQLELNSKANFDVRKITPLLPHGAEHFLTDWNWEKPPVTEANFKITLPAWINAAPAWAEEVLPTMQIDAKIELENGSYRKIPATFASTGIHYSNMVWRLPNIHVARPEGDINLSLVADDRTSSFDFRVNGAIAPELLRPLLGPAENEWLDEVSFFRPPILEARVQGNWKKIETLNVDGKLHSEGFVCRDVEFSSVAANLHYTNLVLRLDDLLLTRHDKQIEADRISLNFRLPRIFFENVASTIDPMLVAHVIGPDVVEVLSPYKFAEPPHVLLNGSLGLDSIDDADMHFQIAGQNFRWGLFQADAGSAHANWVNETLTLTNLNALAYNGGDLKGHAFIDFAPKVKADYRLEVTFTNVDVRSLVLSLDGTNEVEGVLSGGLTVESADTRGLQTWNGHGRAELKDGLIWEMPFFGIFTPILDAIVPGLGKSRARSANANFIITNGVAFSDNFEIRSSGFRMQYRGTLNHELDVNARVMAEPLRDTWAVGKALSAALIPLSKLFEYKITGAVHDPEVKPVYLPKFVVMTLRPFKTIRKLLPGDKDHLETETIPVAQP